MSVVDYSMSVHDFMRASVPLDEAGMAKLRELATQKFGSAANTASADFCLDSAVTYAQADKLPVLVDEFGANVNQYPNLSSDRHPGQLYIHNLLEDAVENYRLRPDTDHSPAGQARLLATVEFLLKRGLSATPNADPLEGAVAEAYLLAHPAEYGDITSPLCDPWGLAIGEEPEAPFTEPYELIKKYQPNAVTAFEVALTTAREEVARDMEAHPENYDVSGILAMKRESDEEITESPADSQSGWRQIAHALLPKIF